MMAKSLAPVSLGQSQWVDLYDATGITVGTAITIQNLGPSKAFLTEADSEPSLSTTGYNVILKYEYLSMSTGSIGAWAYGPSPTKLQVEET